LNLRLPGIGSTIARRSSTYRVAVTLGILADERRTYNEHFQGFSPTKFDGTTSTV
jgi:hypothetical protein